MDNTILLKNNLISRIQNSDDLEFLNALQVIFDGSEKELYKLNKLQEKSIEISRNQIKNGNFKENSEVLKEAKEWLK